MNLRQVLAGAVVLALAGCGGGHGPAEEGARPAAQAQQAAADPTTGALRVFRAFYGRAPTAAEFSAFTSPSAQVLATGFAASFASMGDAALSTAILANMGVNAQSVNAASLSILQTALTQYFGAYGPAARGVIVSNLVGLLAGLESDGTWGTAARSFNAAIDNARAVITASTTGGGACIPTVAQGFQGNIESVVANAGGGGDGSGSGGSGGGAAAGGGLGKVLGGTMTVTELTNGVVVGQGTTDPATGLVTIRTCGIPGPFLLTLEGRSGARYFDEGKNALVEFPAGNVLHALVDQWNEHVGVSPLTEAAYRYALNNFKASPAAIAAGTATLRSDGSLVGLSVAQAQQANAVVASEVNATLPTLYQLASAKALPVPLDASSGSTTITDTRYGRSAAVNGGMVKAATDYNPALQQPALKLAEDIARDLTDGRLDGFSLDGQQVSQANSTAYSSRRVSLSSSLGINAITSRYSTTLRPGELRIEEESTAKADWEALRKDAQHPNAIDAPQNASDCNGFQDEVALMSDRSVTVRRRFPTRVNSSWCQYTFSDEENARVVKMRNFLTGVKTLSRGAETVYAVKEDGSVYGWGGNYCGRLSPLLANGYYPQPVPIEGLRNITSVGTNAAGTIARDSDGVAYYWGIDGRNENGPPQKLCERNTLLVDGQFFDTYQPTTMSRVELGRNVVDVYTHNSNYFALLANGDVMAWGSGFAGLLANSDGTVFGGALTGPTVLQPTKIAGLPPVRQLAFTTWTAYALLKDGTVTAWGDDFYSLLGNGVRKRTTRPTAVPGVSGIRSISADYHAVRLLKNDGTALAWGGADALGFASEVWSPTPIATPERIRHVDGRFGGFSIYFASGRVARELNATHDLNEGFR